MEKTNNNIFNVLLFAIICCLAVYIIIDEKMGFNCKTPTDTNTIYTYEKIAGVYKVNHKIDLPNAEQVGYTLILGEDGTFKYDYSLIKKESISGNYYIKNKKIILNNLIHGGSEITIFSANDYSELEISNNGIIDSNPKYAEETGIKTIELIKQGAKEEIYKSPLRTILSHGDLENKL